MFYIVSIVSIIASILFFKSRIIQLCLLFMIYPITILAGMNYTGESYRIISLVGESYYYDFYGIGYIYQIIFYAIFFTTLLPIRKLNFKIKRLPFDKFTRLILISLLLIFYPIAYPAIFGFDGSRFGSGGSIVIILNALLLLSRTKRLSFVDFIVISINVFALFSGERADSILILFLYYLLSSDGFYIRERVISNIKLITILILILFVGLFAGVNRMGGEVSLDYIIYYLFNQGTAVDVLHVYLSSLWYVDALGYNSKPILNLFSSFIPFNSFGGASSEYNVTIILGKEIANVGGGLYYSAGYLIAGVFGASILCFLYSYFLRVLFTFSDISKILLVCIFIQQLRLQWYGLNYMGNVLSVGLILFTFLYFLKWLTNR